MTSRGLLRCIAIGLGICTLSGWIPDDFIDVDDEEVSEVTVIYQDKFLTQAGQKV